MPEPEIDDSTLLGRARNGDFEAFDMLVSRHEGRVYSIAMAILRKPEEAEDVVQTTFINALEHLAGFREEASFKTWISRIATNTALKALRKRKGLPRVSLDEATSEREDGMIPHPEYIADWRENPAEIIERGELKPILDEAIEALPEKHRVVFILRDIHEISTRETAETLGISEANVKVRLLRARLELREVLTRRFGDPEAIHEEAMNPDAPTSGSTPAEELLAWYGTDRRRTP